MPPYWYAYHTLQVTPTRPANLNTSIETATVSSGRPPAPSLCGRMGMREVGEWSQTEPAILQQKNVRQAQDAHNRCQEHDGVIARTYSRVLPDVKHVFFLLWLFPRSYFGLPQILGTRTGVGGGGWGVSFYIFPLSSKVYPVKPLGFPETTRQFFSVAHASQVFGKNSTRSSFLPII